MAKRTALYEDHVALGARITEFAGWEMPLSYEAGPVAEHLRVREVAGLFDLSHMGQISVSGPDALAFLQYLATTNISRISTGKAGYAPMCYADGGIVDDTFVYHLADYYLVVVNAANIDKDLRWLDYHQGAYDVAIDDLSAETCMLALQGPLAEAILQPCTTYDLTELGYHEVVEAQLAGVDAVVGRTGYTGEDGFELYFPQTAAGTVWGEIMESGQPHGMLPIGLAARDSLRFEPCMALYGHELNHEVTPLQAGLGWAVALKKGGFVGREALIKERLEGPAQKLIGFEMVERGVPRHGYPVIIDGEECGHVTSGLYAPTLEKFLGMAYVPSEHARIGQEISIEVRGRQRTARIVKRPFYTPTYRK